MNDNQSIKMAALYFEGEHLSFVESVCVRPKMYTINGTLEEVAAFIEGFYSGMAKSSKGWEATQPVSEMLGAVCKTLGANQCGWREFFTFLRAEYRSDDEGFYRLAKACIEYRRENDISSV